MSPNLIDFRFDFQRKSGLPMSKEVNLPRNEVPKLSP